jgi:hypothetical protein
MKGARYDQRFVQHVTSWSDVKGEIALRRMGCGAS